jgi:hypothetical protein
MTIATASGYQQPPEQRHHLPGQRLVLRGRLKTSRSFDSYSSLRMMDQGQSDAITTLRDRMDSEAMLSAQVSHSRTLTCRFRVVIYRHNNTRNIRTLQAHGLTADNPTPDSKTSS